ncbi:MAG: SAM-dependent chlorinase/fluorinase [Sedimentisphaerales bacterium]|jgi:S-adenosylmethionine hydrolase
MIVLLTDFGQSEYVGVMKGVIYCIHKDTRVVDLCHDVSPQSLIEASWILKTSYSYFPAGAIFCCVVDPGVGTPRKALAVKTADYHFVGPDNGLLWETLKEQEIVEMRVIPVPKDASRTFHGRDVFAGAAANIDLGRFDALGPKAEDLVKLELYRHERVGTIVRIDRFGNIVTNLPSEGKTSYSVEAGRHRRRMDFYPNYDAAPGDELFLIEGSYQTLEISVRNGNANERLRLEAGSRVEII